MKRLLIFLLCATALFGCGRKQKEIVIIPDIEKNHLQRSHIFGQVKAIESESVALVPDSAGGFVAGDTLSRIVQHFSPDGYLTNIIKLGNDGDTVSKEIITYSSEAKELAHETYDGENILKRKTTFDYNRYGFKSKESCYLLDSLLYFIDYKTDDKGNVIEMTHNRGGVAMRSRIAYNKAGLVARIEEFEPSGKLFKYATVEYDNYGDEVNRRVFKTGDELIEYTYTEYTQEGRVVKIIYEDRLHSLREVSVFSDYDEHGNWTKEEKSVNNRPIYCRNRNITYY
ncbi:MAG: hypothetical protein J6W84_00325 [Bacteroidales bacterium]|nr:hypothetical protein [Bacteroidales bacterium]MBQ7490809.1 hypothetical protein [Bacteroidales bacterium]